MNRKWKKAAVSSMIMGVFLAFCGCSVQKIDREKESDIAYEIVEELDIPEELKAEIEKRKEEAFLCTYADKGQLYIVRGYGEQESGGYEIQVRELYESSNAIVLQTDFWGPEHGTEYEKKPSFPYIVLKMEDRDKYVFVD